MADNSPPCLRRQELIEKAQDHLTRISELMRSISDATATREEVFGRRTRKPKPVKRTQSQRPGQMHNEVGSILQPEEDCRSKERRSVYEWLHHNSDVETKILQMAGLKCENNRFWDRTSNVNSVAFVVPDLDS